MTRFPQDIPPDILSRADDLLSAKYGTDRPIDPEIVELVCRGMMEERERAVKIAEEHAAAWGLSMGSGAIEIAKAIRGTE